ncbi:MAG: molybdenum cofactor synthesis domain-containing protein [Bacillota bacterium]|nr:molybdenum cofactor synthesis domain-containing protein [Bacillota bacterium]
MGEIVTICTSSGKGQPKIEAREGTLIKNEGLAGDAHAVFTQHQVSLLAEESIAKMDLKGSHPGSFAENLTTRGIDLANLAVGTRLQIGPEAILRITQVGREGPNDCAIFDQVEECMMPREGIFTEVLAGGKIKVGDYLDVKRSYRFAVITASDKGAAGEREDLSGPAIEQILLPLGDVIESVIVPDDQPTLAKMMRRMIGRGVNAIFTTGGTGLGPRDITPEATLDVVDRLVPGIGEAVRRETSAATPRAMLSRAIAGISSRTLIINLPGSPKAVVECLAVIIPVLEHALETVCGEGGECART